MADNKPLSAQETVKQLGEQLVEAQKKGLVETVEKLSKQFQDGITAAKAELQAEWDARMAKYAVPGLNKDDKEVKDFQFTRLFRAMLNGDKDCDEVHMCLEADREHRALMGGVSKDMVTTAGGVSYIVPTQVWQGGIVPLLQAQVTAYAAGVTRLDNLDGIPFEIPRLAGGFTTQWGGSEAFTVNSSDATFSQLELRPHPLASRTRVSNRTLESSSPAAEQVLRTQMATNIGLAEDIAIYNGLGTSGQPTGILQSDGIQTYGSTIDPDASLGGSYDQFIEVEHLLRSANAMPLGTPRWIMHENVYRDIRKIKDTAVGSPPVVVQQLDRRMIDNVALPEARFMGYPFTVTTNMPTTRVIFGIMPQCYVGHWGTMMVSVLPMEVHGIFRQTQIMIGLEVDVGLGQPSAFIDVPVS